MTIGIYRSDDTAAPLLTPTIGSFNALMKACLVTGYGSNISAGWALEVEDLVAGKSILSNSSGNMIYLQHDEYSKSTGGTTGGFKFAFACGLESYSNINDLHGTYPRREGNLDYPNKYGHSLGSVLLCSAESFTNGLKWILFADSKTVYIIIQTRSNLDGSLDPTILNYGSTARGGDLMYVFGEYSTNNPNNKFNCIINAPSFSTPIATSSNYWLLSTSESYYINAARNGIGDIGGVEVSALPTNNYATSEIYGGRCYNNILNSYIPYPTPSGHIFTSDISIESGNNIPENTRELMPSELFLGYYRGIKMNFHTLNPVNGDNIGNFGDTYTVNGRSYMLVSASVNNTYDYTMSIDITGWD